MIWIIGSKGLLGRELCQFLGEKGLKVIGTDKEVDVLSPAALNQHVRSYKPKYIINCSGYTDIDKAEEEWDSALMLNKMGPESVARIAEELRVPLIHFSSDQVFDGKGRTPLVESDPTKPCNAYGASKLAGEWAVKSECSRYFIIRTARLYGAYGRNPILKFLSTVDRGENYNLGYDRIVSPTWTRNLAIFVYRIIASGSKKYGIYHYAGKGECSRHELALSAYHQARKNGWLDKPLDLTLVPETGRANRPEYTVLSSEKAVQAFDAKITPWEDALGAFLSTVHKDHIEQL